MPCREKKSWLQWSANNATNYISSASKVNEDVIKDACDIIQVEEIERGGAVMMVAAVDLEERRYSVRRRKSSNTSGAK